MYKNLQNFIKKSKQGFKKGILFALFYFCSINLQKIIFKIVLLGIKTSKIHRLTK